MIHQYPWILHMMMNLKFDNFYVCILLFIDLMQVFFFCLFLYVNFVLLSLCMNEQFSFFSSTLYSCPCLCVSCDIFLNRNQQYVQKKTKKYEFFYICVYICISGVFFFFKTLEKKISSETKVMIHSFLFIQL